MILNRSFRRLAMIAAAPIACLAGLIAASSYFLTAPLEEPIPVGADGGRPPIDPIEANGQATIERGGGASVDPGLAEWPVEPLDGRPAKAYLLAFMRRAADRLDAVEGYTATMHRQERIGGTLGPEQILQIKVSHHPFSVYLRFEAPNPGKEAIFRDGSFGDQIIAHDGGWTRRLIPRIKLDPTGPIALADNRHPITEVGLANLATRLLHYREMDLDDPDAGTVLDRIVDDRGRPWYRSIHTHPVNTGERPFAYVEVHYSPELLIPVQIASFDWPLDDQDAVDLRLAEHYRYEDIDLDVALTAFDFDPSNPDYEFQRY